jgi:hypothetical protein
MSHPDLSRLFEAERAVRPSAGAAERGLARLLSDVAINAAPASVVATAAKLSWAGVTKWIVAGAVVGVAGSGTLAYTVANSTSTPAPGSAAVPAATVTAEPIATSRPAASAPSVANAVPAAPTVVRRAGSVPLPQPVLSAGAGSFDAELRLIQRAKTELDQHRPAQAAAWLAEHAQRFPSGVFAPDREALQVLASCSQRLDPARALRFAEKHPGSPMNERLLRDCGAPKSSKSLNEPPGVGEHTDE